ncbi:SAM-dependent methyltransferase [Pseudofrankia saprophytica]|uniref:SAM-dependent methyltransferase n=1 Tax=Pseudofrankia saprophytica TaxID=298655 RepID=UPI000234C30F|nr:SAM-dependent methyltransferase [Pseudofrankia saprophytica]
MTSTGPMLARRHGGSIPIPVTIPARSNGRDRGLVDGPVRGAQPARPTGLPAVSLLRSASPSRTAEPLGPAGPAWVSNLIGSPGSFWQGGQDESMRPVGPRRPVEQTGPDGGLTVPIPTEFHPEGDLNELPTPGGIHDALLGGTSHRRVDRQWALRILLEWPEAPAAAHASKEFLVQAVRFAARNGVRQFLALSGGAYAADPVHEIACAVAPESRTVYVEPRSQTMTRVASNVPAELATVVRADPTRPAEVLAHRGVRARLDVTRPIALLVVPGMPHIADHEDLRAVLLGYREATARGSLLIFSQLCDEGSARGLRWVLTQAGLPGSPRPHAQAVDVVSTWEPIEPGLVPAEEWHAPDECSRPHFGRLPVYASIGWH